MGKKNNAINAKFKLYIQKNLKSDYLIAGYGAPTKASLLLTMANLGINEVSFIIEDNELKVGRYLPKTGIPIVCIKGVKKKEAKFNSDIGLEFC